MKITNKVLIKTTLGIIILCVCYAVIGRLSLMLAIPPGYATAIFPPAGISTAALLIWGTRLWPGIFLGSVLLNIWISISHDPLTIAELEFAISAASGATLQAIAGAWLVRRFIGFPTPLSKEFDIFRFMILAGPIACIINASFGVTSLYLTGIIPPAEYAFSWFTWWVGDTIGILITTPLMFIAFAEPRPLWKNRLKAVAIPLLLMLAVIFVLFFWVSKWELERTQFDFKESSNHVYERFRTNIESYIDTVSAVERFFSSSQKISREEFRNFVTLAIAKRPGISGISWNPVVTNSQRQLYEVAIRNEGLNDFQITERNHQGQLVSARQRNEYITVNYIEPFESNKKAIGFDIASNPLRSKALMEARKSGKAVATEKITLVQEHDQHAGFLLLQPVYSDPHSTVEQRITNLKGFAVGIFRISNIVDSILDDHFRNNVNIDIYQGKSTDNVHLYGPDNIQQFSNAIYKFSNILEVGGQYWRVNFWPSDEYLANHRGWQAWAVLATGLLFIGISGIFLLTMTGRSYEIESLVRRRTAELSGILSSSIETIITLDENGKIETVNPAGESLFGYSASELSGMLITRIIPEFFNAIDNKNKLVRNSSPPNGNRRDTQGIRKDQSNIPIELATSTLKVADRQLYTAIIHDLTERTKIARMKDEFISTVSHELRTPLTSIKGTLGLISGGVLGEVPDKMKDMLTIAYQNSERLGLLINDLLDINKSQSIETAQDKQAISVNSLINKALLANQGYADSYSISYSWQPSEPDVNIYGDENRLIQVLSNLLSNAVKYSQQNTVVQLSTSFNNNRVRIVVADTGPGIPLEFQANVFERFTQADSSDTRRVGGTGLGLAITKSIIEAHDGCIGFDSTPGHGTEFYVDLPIYNNRT